MTDRIALILTAAIAACGCSPREGPQTGGQTNWLVRCATSDECGELECICGSCSSSCEGGAGCADLPDAMCVAAGDEAAAALCPGQAAPAGVCLPSCELSCDAGLHCVAGACVPIREGAVKVSVDTAATQGTLLGFGASLAYAEDVIVASAHKAALYELAFTQAGLDVLRMRNRYGTSDDPDLSAPAEIVSEASTRIGTRPQLFMTSATPPEGLKANASTTCAGDASACTLASLQGGGFDYVGFAAFWRRSLQGYATAGIAPDFVGIQNDPDWVPAADAPHEACRFLPQEGSIEVDVDGVPTQVRYPGYREALIAVRAAVADLPEVTAFVGPEASALGAVAAYAAAMDASTVDALAIHLYGVDTDAVDTQAFVAVRAAAAQLGRPVFQTEVQAGGLQTAVLIHHAFADAGVTAYLQNDLVSWMPEQAPIALLHLTDTGAEPQGPYWAMLHYAKDTAPGWVGVAVESSSGAVLGTAWMAPDGRALSVVLVNAGDVPREAVVEVPANVRAALPTTRVTRTVFAATERAAALGELAASALVQLPAGSVLTVTFAE